MGGGGGGDSGGGRSDGPYQSRPSTIQAKKDKARQEQARIERGLSTADAYRQISERRAAASDGSIKVGSVSIPTTAGVVGGAISKMNLNNIERVLKGGGKAVFSKSGTLMGAVDKSGRYSGRPEGDPKGVGTTVFGQIDPRSIPDDENAAPFEGQQQKTPEEIAATAAAEEETIMTRGRKRTRGKRAGQGGTLLEGYGSLYRGGSGKGVS